MVGKNMDAQRRSNGEHKRTYSIGDLAREFEISLRTPRFYEDRGLFTPYRKGAVRYSRVCILDFQGFQQVESLRIGLTSPSRVGNLRPQLAALQ
jgi:hypothetical protein